jgi:glycosyltransferase involved in cell wall biosynthesis
MSARIAIYSPLDPTFVGGFRRWIETFWSPYAESRDLDVRILHCGFVPEGKTGDLQPLRLSPRIAVREIPSRGFPLLAAPLPNLGALRDALAGCAAVYVDNGYALHDVAALHAAKRAGVPAISGHHAVIRHGVAHALVWDLVGKAVIGRFDAVHVLNADDDAYLRGAGARGVHRIALPIGDAFFAASVPREDQIAFIGRLHPQKGIDRLVAIAKRLAQVEPGLVLVIAGTGPDREKLAEIESLPNVRYVGPVDGPQAARLLAASRATIMPSRYETFGVVAAESLAAGTPVIASDVAGLRDMIAGDRGTLVETPDDVWAWLSALSDTIARSDGPARRIGISEQCRSYAREAFAFDAIAGRFDRIFAELNCHLERTS